MVAALVTLTALLCAAVGLSCYLWGMNRLLHKLVRRQERGLRRAIRTAERWQDALLTGRGAQPVNFPPTPQRVKEEAIAHTSAAAPHKRKDDPILRVARTPHEAIMRSRQERSRNGRPLTEEERAAALKAAEEFTPDNG